MRLFLTNKIRTFPQALDDKLVSLCSSVDVPHVICSLVSHDILYHVKEDLPVVVSK